MHADFFWRFLHSFFVTELGVHLLLYWPKMTKMTRNVPKVDRNFWIDVHKYKMCFNENNLEYDMSEAVQVRNASYVFSTFCFKS